MEQWSIHYISCLKFQLDINEYVPQTTGKLIKQEDQMAPVVKLWHGLSQLWMLRQHDLKMWQAIQNVGCVRDSAKIQTEQQPGHSEPVPGLNVSVRHLVLGQCQCRDLKHKDHFKKWKCESTWRSCGSLRGLSDLPAAPSNTQVWPH